MVSTDNDRAVDDERHPVAQLVGGRHVVGGEEHRRPRAFRSRTMFLTLRAFTGSMPEVGSSRNNSSGLLISDRANVSRICIPLEYLPTRVPASSAKPTASSSSIGSSVSPSYSEAKKRRFSRPVSFW